jgi:hypothetical protein
MITRVLIALMMVPALASADDGAAELDHGLPTVVPGTGLDKAPVRSPPWCGAPKEREERWGYVVKSRLDDYDPTSSARPWPIFDAAVAVCNAPNNPVAQRAAAVTEQLWINATGLSEADAVASLKAHFDQHAFESERDQFCKTIPGLDSNNPRVRIVDGERALFGCAGSPQWMMPGEILELRDEVDRGDVEDDPLLRVTWVLNRLRSDLDPSERVERTLPGYVLDQFDIHVSANAVMKWLDAPPYRGNHYARIIALESVARVRMLAARLDAVVAAKVATDASWKELLVTAPKRGFDRWVDAAVAHKDELARSDAFVAKARASESVKGCATPLRADIAAMMKTLKHDSLQSLRDQLSDQPIAGLLFARLVQCMALDGEKQAAGWIAHVREGIRYLRGPREAAFFAEMEALAAIKAEKGHTPFELRNLTQLDFDDLNGHGGIHPGPMVEGVIASVTSTNDALKVKFVQHRQQVMQQDCHEGKKVDSIDPESGKVSYRRECHDAGLAWETLDPDPIVVPTRFAAGLKAGRFIRFNSADHGTAIPLEVYADKNAKHLVAFFSFALE